MACVFCGAQRGLDRRSGFDLCEECGYGAGLVDVQLRHGFLMHTETWERSSGGDNPTTYLGLQIHIDLPRAPDAAAHFGREVRGIPLLEWLGLGSGKDHEVGDPLFDDAVWITEDEGTDIAALLADEGVQTAIMELVSRGGVRLGRGFVRVRRESSAARPSLADHGVPLTLFAMHVDRWVAGRHG